MMFRAEEWGLRERGSNPRSRHREEPEETDCPVPRRGRAGPAGRALDAREAAWPEAVAAIRLLALTGCRRSEVPNLRWRGIGEDALDLPDSKTGRRAVLLGHTARALIEAVPGARDPGAFLFPRHAEGRGTYSLTTCRRTGLRGREPRQAPPARSSSEPSRASPSWRARTCRSWASCSATGSTAARRATRTFPTGTWVEAAEKVGAIIFEGRDRIGNDRIRRYRRHLCDWVAKVSCFEMYLSVGNNLTVVSGQGRLQSPAVSASRFDESRCSLNTTFPSHS